MVIYRVLLYIPKNLIILPLYCLVRHPLGARLSIGYGAFSREFTSTILVSQNNETAAMLVPQTNHVGVEPFSYAKTFFSSNTFARLLVGRVSEYAL